jgi:pimeloyl-ACP methyl ester carboxylesterase
MAANSNASNVAAPTLFVRTDGQRYAYRRFGRKGALAPLLFLQHFTGTLDNWDPAVTDPLAEEREVILYDNAGIGRSSGEVPGAFERGAHVGSARAADASLLNSPPRASSL